MCILGTNLSVLSMTDIMYVLVMDCGKQTFSFVDALFVSLIICFFEFILNSILHDL